MCSEVIQLSVTAASAAANHGNPDDTEKADSTAGTVVPESDIKTASEIFPIEADVHTKAEDEVSDTNNTQYSKSDGIDDKASSSTNMQSSTIATAEPDKDGVEASDADSQHSQSNSSTAPKTVQQHIKESGSVDSRVAAPFEKTDSLYPFRTHFMQVNGSRDDTED